MQKILVLFTIINLLGVFVFWVTENLTVQNIFLLNIFEWAFASWLTTRLYKRNIDSNSSSLDIRDYLIKVFKEYWHYCYPFIPFYFVAFISEFSDRWFLQHFDGSVHQAYYAISMQFSSISLIVTASLMKILWKEVAEENERGNTKKVEKLYKQTFRSLFIFSIMISGFLIPWGNEITAIFLGEEYINGSIVIMIMLLHPINLTIGHVNGALYYALELTKPYAIINIIQMLISPFITYLMLAPESNFLPGFDLGSTGLAIKMVLIGIIGQNYLMWWLMRKQGWKFSIIYNFVSMFIFIFAGFVIYFATKYFIVHSVHVIIRVAVAALIYFGFSIFIIYYNPWLVGSNKSELINYKHRLLSYLKR